MSYRLLVKKKWLTDNELLLQLHGPIYTLGDFSLNIFRPAILTNARPTLSNYWRGYWNHERW